MATNAAPPNARPRLAEWREGAAPGTQAGVPTVDLLLYQGDPYAAIFEIQNPDGTPADITGFTATAQIRNGPADLFATVITEFACLVEPALSIVTLSLTKEQTASFGSEALFFDLELMSEGVPTTVIRGSLIVTLEITRPGVGL